MIPPLPGPSPSRLPGRKLPLVFILATPAASLPFGKRRLADLSDPLRLVLSFGRLLATILWAALKVVCHADCLAVKLG